VTNLPDGCTQGALDRAIDDEYPAWEPGDDEPMTPRERNERDREEDTPEEDIRF